MNLPFGDRLYHPLKWWFWWWFVIACIFWLIQLVSPKFACIWRNQEWRIRSELLVSILASPNRMPPTWRWWFHVVEIPSGQQNHTFFWGRPSINGPFSMVMLNNQRVYVVVSFIPIMTWWWWVCSKPSPKKAVRLPHHDGVLRRFVACFVGYN